MASPGQHFNGRHVVVTGGASGFGEALAQAFAAQGAAVMVADVDGPGAARVAAGLTEAIPFAVDVTSEEQNASMAAAAVDAWGGIDVVCANAGGAHRMTNLVDLPTSEFDRMFALNVRSVYLAAKCCVPHMPAGGAIVATASIGGIRPRPGLTAYNASKGAVVTLVRGLAVELAPDIRVNAVLPVSSATHFDDAVFGSDAMPESMPASMEEAIVSGIPMGRRAEPHDVADAVLFLASDAAAFLTGVCLDVDGGRSIQ
jgi:3-oxoacyl-[acyl-carrier protein] reductase